MSMGIDSLYAPCDCNDVYRPHNGYECKAHRNGIPLDIMREMLGGLAVNPGFYGKSICDMVKPINPDAAFYENQLAQRAVWAAEDYKRYQKAKFFLLNGSPYSVHVPKNRDIVEFLEQHYPNFKEEDE